MGSMHSAVRRPVGMPFRPGERRKNPRFDMHFSVFLRAMGEPWVCCETSDVSAAGACFFTNRPFSLHAPIEYVLTFPPELTKARHHLRMRFYASVVRCERTPGGSGTYGVAVRNTAHRYLTYDEAADFDHLESGRASFAGTSFDDAEHNPGT